MCNLACAWCDTPYTWDETRYDVDAECPPATAEQILDSLGESPLLVISGGEPLLHGRSRALQRGVGAWPTDIHVETNGTIPPPQWLADRVALWSVSPKLAHSGDPERKRVNPRALAAFRDLAAKGRAVFKFVCRDGWDVIDAQGYAEEYRIAPEWVWIMPEGTDPAVVIGNAVAVAPAAAERGYNLSLRNHVLMYGKERRR
jgi:organic radical activating enzyme